MDQYISYFISKFGSPSTSKPVPAASFAKYQSILPECLLSLWREQGWAGFKDGLFYIVDPDEFAEPGNAWVSTFPEFSETGIHVFGRSAFGSLYAYHAESGKVLDIICPLGYIMSQKSPSKGKISHLQMFFAAADSRSFDLVDQNKIAMFELALDRLGPLSDHELYGWELPATPECMLNLNYLRKLPVQAQLNQLRLLCQPSLHAI